jgi:hypothetical protein
MTQPTRRSGGTASAGKLVFARAGANLIAAAIPSALRFGDFLRATSQRQDALMTPATCASPFPRPMNCSSWLSAVRAGHCYFSTPTRVWHPSAELLVDRYLDFLLFGWWAIGYYGCSACDGLPWSGSGALANSPANRGVPRRALAWGAVEGRSANIYGKLFTAWPPVRRSRAPSLRARRSARPRSRAGPGAEQADPVVPVVVVGASPFCPEADL